MTTFCFQVPSGASAQIVAIQTIQACTEGFWRTWRGFTVSKFDWIWQLVLFHQNKRVSMFQWPPQKVTTRELPGHPEKPTHATHSSRLSLKSSLRANPFREPSGTRKGLSTTCSADGISLIFWRHVRHIGVLFGCFGRQDGWHWFTW